MSGPIGSKGDKGIYNMDENVHRLATILHSFILTRGFFIEY